MHAEAQTPPASGKSEAAEQQQQQQPGSARAGQKSAVEPLLAKRRPSGEGPPAPEGETLRETLPNGHSITSQGSGMFSGSHLDLGRYAT